MKGPQKAPKKGALEGHAAVWKGRTQNQINSDLAEFEETIYWNPSKL